MNYLENISEQMQIDGMIINIECDSKNSDQILEYVQTWKQIGVVTKDIYLYDRLKVKEYLRLFGRLNKIDRYQDIVDIMDLNELMNLRCHQLTHSQKKRVAIARELLRDPKIMYIQEPLKILMKPVLILYYVGSVH